MVDVFKMVSRCWKAGKYAGRGLKIIFLPVFVGNVGGRLRTDIHSILRVVFRWFLLGF